MKKDLLQFLYQVRINAKVFIIELPNSDISAYTHERAVLMEERQQMLEQIKLTRKEKRNFIQNIVDSSHRRGSTYSPPTSDKLAYRHSWSSILSPHYTQPPTQMDQTESNVNTDPPDSTPSKKSPRFEVQPADETNPTSVPLSPDSSSSQSGEKRVTFSAVETPEPTQHNLRYMNTSVQLNELIVERSHDAALVVVNLPSPPVNHHEEDSYMAFLEVLTEGLDRVLMIRGGGREVVSIF